MAFLSVDMRSEVLLGTVNFKMLLPNDLPEEERAGNPHYKRQTKTLYLLHGFTGSNMTWLLQTRAVEYANKYNLALVFPAGYNSFYLDLPATGMKFGEFIGRELPAYVEKTFGLSAAREDKFIGGLSMGGFGAVHAGFAYAEDFSKILAFSAAFIIGDIAGLKENEEHFPANYAYYRTIFGDLEKVLESENNPEVLLRALKAEGREIPALYLAIGTEDFLYKNNQAFRAFLDEEAVPYVYKESPGLHDFDFWSRELEPGIRWLLD